jgi:hypothetical protein
MLIRNDTLWQLRLGSLWITRVKPRRWEGQTKPGTLTVWLGRRLLVSKLS